MNIHHIIDSWLEETKSIFKDGGALLFCIVLPLAYPLIYSWIYNNEVAREVPVAIVDRSHSSMSREFIQKVDASPDVSVALYCGSLQEGKEAVGRGDVYGVIYFPEDFAIKTGRMQQTTVSVYCDMSFLLTYKAIYMTCTNVSFAMGDEIKAQLTPGNTSRQAEIQSMPLKYHEVPIFNTTMGYGNFILPAVLVLMIQQAMMLAVGLLAGTDRERGWRTVKGVWSSLIGKTAAYSLVFFPMLAYTTLVVPRMFGFVSMCHMADWLLVMVPYIVACAFFSFALSAMVRYRENVILLVVFTSLPFLFLTGVSWPQTNIPGFWAGTSYLIPSTLAVRAFVKMSSMGARIGDFWPEICILWLQVLVYGIASVVVIYRRKMMNKAIHDSSVTDEELELNDRNAL